MILSNYFINKKINSLMAEGHKRRPALKTFDQIQTIMLLFEMSDAGEVNRIIDTLRKLDKQIISFAYVRKEPLSEGGDSFHLIAEQKDVTCWGFPSDRVSQEMLSTSADAIIDLTHPGCYAIQYLLLKHPCTFKVGIKKPEKELHDFSIVVTDREEIGYLFEQILFYLQNIRAK